MAENSNRPLRWLRSSPGLWVVVALAAAALGLTAAPLSDGVRLQAMLLVALACTAAAGLIERGRARRLARLEHHADRLLTLGAARTPTAEPLAPAPPDGGEFGRIDAMLDEVGERISRQLKEVAKKSRNLESLIDALDEPVLATNSVDKVLLCNRAAEDLLDARPGQLIGRDISALFTQAELLEMHASARQGQTRRGRIKLTTTLGARVYQVSAAPVPAAWGEGVFGSVILLRDVTELDRAVQVKTDFVANASHELRTPVTAIQGAVETLLDGAKDDPVMGEKLLRMVRSHAARLEEMIRDLLDLSRLETDEIRAEPEPVDLREVQSSLRSMFEGVCLERKLDLAFQLEPALAGLTADPRLLMLVLRNLVENATKFAYEGTRITIAARRLNPSGTPPGGPVHAPPVAPGFVRFEVTDRGVGIPLHLRERVFERYFQVDTARTGVVAKRGTGLGLSIVKHAVKAMGGEVGLDSVYREGTTVWFEIPVTFAREALSRGA